MRVLVSTPALLNTLRASQNVPDPEHGPPPRGRDRAEDDQAEAGQGGAPPDVDALAGAQERHR